MSSLYIYVHADLVDKPCSIVSWTGKESCQSSPPLIIPNRRDPSGYASVLRAGWQWSCQCPCGGGV